MDKINSIPDLYNFVLTLIDVMKSIGDDSSVVLLQNALLQQQRSEWLGELNLALKTIQKRHKKEISQAMDKEIEEAIRAIDKAFRNANSPFS